MTMHLSNEDTLGYLHNSDSSAKRQDPDQEKPIRQRRLTIDIPNALHQKMKVRAAVTGITMGQEVRDLLERHYAGPDDPMK